MAKKKNVIEAAIGKLMAKNDAMMTRVGKKLKPIGMSQISSDSLSTEQALDQELKRKQRLANMPSPYSKVPKPKKRTK